MGLVAAFRPPDDPPPRKRYLVRGTVKNGDTYNPISGATVKIYVGSSYKGSTSTSSTGYFSRYIYSYTTISSFTVKVTKTGYYMATKSAPVIGTTCNLGNVYMTPIPPPEPPASPVISNVQVNVDGFDAAMSWDVSWGSGATWYSVEMWWGTDSDFTSETAYLDDSSGDTHYTVTNLPTQFSYNAYWYRIEAENGNSAGSTEATPIGPNEVLLKHYPIDDAFTYAEMPDYRFGYEAGYIDKIWAATGDPESPGWFYGYLKFDIDHPELVKRATLYAYDYQVELYGHGTIYAYECGTNWVEESITYANSHQSVSVGNLLDYDFDGSSGSWDDWDVTAACSEEFSILLKPSPGTMKGAHYYSKESSNENHRPYLLIEYYGEPEDQPPPSPYSSFVDDQFTGLDLNPVWDVTTVNSPDWDYDVGISADEGCSMDLDYTDLNSPYQHSEERGYYFEQTNLDISDEFDFEMKLGWLVTSSAPSIQLGIELLGGVNLDIVIAEIVYFYDMDNYKHWIVGQAGSQEEYEQIYNHWDEVLFRLQRDPYNSRITLSGCEDLEYGQGYNSHTLLQGVQDSTTVRAVRLKMSVWAPYEASIFHTEVDFVKQNHFETMKNPASSLAPFEDPLSEWGFEETSLSAWKNGEVEPYGDAKGSRSDYTIERSHSWEAKLVTVPDKYWSLIQQVSSSCYDAMKDRTMGFSFYARHSSTYSKVRAMIQYWVDLDGPPVVVSGDWIELSPGDGDEWSSVYVTTEHPIPNDIQSIEVRIAGMAVEHGMTFTGFVDAACLYIVNDDMFRDLDEHYGYWQPEGDRGVVSMTTNTLKAEVSQGVGYTHILGSSISVEANQDLDFVVRRVRVGWEVDGYSGQTTNNAHLTECIEGNSANEYDEPHGFWNTIVAFVGSPLMKFVTTAVKSYIFYKTGGNWFLKAIVSSAIDSAISFVFQPKYRKTDFDTASIVNGVKTRGYVDISYTTDMTDVYWADLSLQFTWEVDGTDHEYIRPSLRITVYVEWWKEGSAGVDLETSYSTVYMFDTTSP
jgi:hypothetical protein